MNNSPKDGALPKVIEREMLVKGKKYSYEKITVRSPAGKVHSREVVRHPGAVIVVPILDDGRIVMIRNYRITVERWLVELCAGTIEHNDPPIQTAKRELIEETGFEAGKIEHLASFYTTPGLTDEMMHAFVACDLKDVGQDLEDDEMIEVVKLTPGEAMGLISSGEMVDAKSMVALYLARERGYFARV
jgi:ADP-ribose pyrophosphatase